MFQLVGDDLVFDGIVVATISAKLFPSLRDIVEKKLTILTADDIGQYMLGFENAVHISIGYIQSTELGKWNAALKRHEIRVR